MAELGIALIPLLLLAALALAALSVSLPTLAVAALGLTGAGLVLGVPGGLYYHLALRRELLRTGPLPRRWYWHPQRYHPTLDHAALRRVQLSFWVGGLGFGLVMLGLTLAITALALWFRAGGAMLGLANV